MKSCAKAMRLSSISIVSVLLFLGGGVFAADILEDATLGGTPGTDWNQGSQWMGAAVPTAGNNYVLHTNTANNSGLSGYYGVSFGTGYLRTPANGSASVFLGDAILLPPGTEILMKETPGGSAGANISFTNYNNVSAANLYPLVRLAPNNSGSGTVTLTGTIKVATDAYIALDYGGGSMILNIASTVSGASNLTFVSSAASGSSFSATRTNLVTGDWSGFTGTLNVGNAKVAATVELGNSAVNVNMALALPRTNAILRLDKGISVRSFSITNHLVSAGTYLPAQLTALGLGGIFSGEGALTVGFTAPPRLVATPGNGQVKLSWQAVYAAASYNVNRATSSGAEMTITNVTGTSFTDAGLSNGTTYYYTVSAINGEESESGPSDEVSVTPDETAGPPKIVKVYLQGGQSNSDGRAVTNGLPPDLLNPQSDVRFYYYLTGGAANGDGTLGTLTTLRPGASALGGGATFGPELTFGRGLADYYALSNGVPTNTVLVAIIKYAHGGTSLINGWAANGTSSTNGDGSDYVIFQKVVSAGLSRLAAEYPDASLELDGMIWVQGESDIDAGAGASSAYGTNLIRFINDVRLTYAPNGPYGTNLPFFFSRLSANQTVYSNPSDPDYSNYLLLRAGQEYAATNLSQVFMLDTDAAKFSTATPWSSPGLHFDTQGQESLGAAFGRAAVQALPRPQMQIPEKQGRSWRLQFNGVPGTTHGLERASRLSGPWTVLTNLVIGATGTAACDDPNPPDPAGFYRVGRP